MKVDIQETGVNERQIDLVLESADFSSELNKKLKEIREKTNIKGFRQGKTPMSFVKRNYGKQAAAEVISDKTMKTLSDIIEENKFDLFNEPLLLDSRVPALEDGDLDADCTFSYIVGLMPQGTLKGVSSTDTYQYYELEVDAAKIDERMATMQQQLGEHIHPDDIIEKDVVEIEASELEGDTVKPDGITATFKFATDLIANDELKSKILGLSKADTFTFNIRDIERDRNDDYIRQYFLKINEDADDQSFSDAFSATIISIHRQVPAELNADFFEKGFPPHITNEEEAREEIKNQYIKGYGSVGDNLLLRKVIDTLTEQNKYELPEKYVHQLLHANGGSHSDKDLEDFSVSMRRQILISQILKTFGIQVTHDDLREKVIAEFSANLGGMSLPPETLDRIVENALKEEKYARELQDRVLNDKLIQTVKNAVTLDIIKKPEVELLKIYDEVFPRNTSEEEE